MILMSRLEKVDTDYLQIDYQYLSIFIIKGG